MGINLVLKKAFQHQIFSTVHQEACAVLKTGMLLFLTNVLSCQNKDISIEITKQVVREDVPSASGVVSHQGFHYIVGDDSPYLFKLNNNYEVIDRFLIYSSEFELERDRLPKSTKPDFEAMELVSEKEMIIFGSGSKSPYRDLMISITMDDSLTVKQYDLTAFYKILRSNYILSGHELNIEGVAYMDNRLLLFNRGKNVLFQLNYDSFRKHLENPGYLPEIVGTEFHLPSIKGIQAGFSGASIDHKTGKLLVTASVENTANAYEDGNILGSFVGVSHPNSRGDYESISWIPIQNTSEPLKIESISITDEAGANKLELIMVTDSDGGHSLCLKAVLSF